MVVTPEPGITKVDETHGEVTVRRWFKDGQFIRADVYVNGWKKSVLRHADAADLVTRFARRAFELGI